MDTNEGVRKPWFHKYRNTGRAVLSVLSRLHANHYNLGETLARKHLKVDPGCDCVEGEDVVHVLWECARYDDLRTTMVECLAERGVNERTPSASL